MKRKKILLLLMATALTMAACGNAETANNSKTEPTEATQEAENEETDEVTETSSTTTEPTKEITTEPTEEITPVAEQTESNNSGEVNISIETLENSQVASDGVKVYTYSYDYPTITIEGNADATAAITADQEARKSEFMEKNMPNLSTALEAYESGMLGDEFYGEGYDKVSYYVGMHNESVISLYYKTDSYCIGGMHGNITWSTINYDTATGTILTLADMFEDRDTAAESIKENILNQCIAQNIQGYGENERLQAINEIVEGENWYLAEDGIHFWANEYTLGGVEEIYEFVIGYDELTGWKE